MRTVHFLDLRDEHATEIRRGEVYYYCHPQVGCFEEDWFPTSEYDVWRPPTAQASIVLATSGIVTVPLKHALRIAQFGSYSDKMVTGWFSMSERGYVHFNFLSDSGVPEIAFRNYVLNKNELLRKGIRVDLSTVTL